MKRKNKKSLQKKVDKSLREIIEEKLKWASQEKLKGLKQINNITVQINRLDGVLLFCQDILNSKKK